MPRAPLPSPRPGRPGPPLPAPRRPLGARSGAPQEREVRPRVEPDLALFGFSRRTRSRRGARIYHLFFVLLFVTIAVQTVVSLF